jgi:uncharacterized protein YidB (DUF937 family)
MDLLKLGSQLLTESLGQQSGGADLEGALSSLLGGGDGGVDLASLVGNMTSNGELGDIVSSWLGDGANSPISADKLMGLFGEEQLSQFASLLGTDTQGAANSLTDVLPKLVDQSSSGGNLLDSVGGAEGLLGMAKSLLK